MTEKLICAIKSNIGDLKDWGWGRYYLDVEDALIEIVTEIVDKKNRWKKFFSIERDVDYYKRFISFGGAKYLISEEEYLSIITLREEVVKEKQEDILNKLCNSAEKK